jgi:hypothetical protein
MGEGRIFLKISAPSLFTEYLSTEPIVLAGSMSLDTTFRAQVKAKLGRVGYVRKIKRK